MQLRFPEAEISHWANQYSFPREESELMSLRDSIQSQGHLTKAQLALLARWKSPRSAPRVKNNSEKFVQEITTFAFNAKDERCRIESLTLLDGVLWPTASVVLHLFHKDPYPILDFRAIWSVQTDQPRFYSFPFWWQYVECCRGLAERNGVEMRLLDRALWQYSKANQPKGTGSTLHSEKLLIEFEGGAVYTAKRGSDFLIIINQVALLDLLDPEDQDGIEGVRELAFPSEASRVDYIRKRGWSSAV